MRVHGVRALFGYSSDHRPVIAWVNGKLCITYNAGNRSNKRVLRDLRRLLKLHPWMFALEEVSDRAAVLKQVAREFGYDLFQMHGHSAMAHTAMLAHPDANARIHSFHQISPRAKVGHLVAGSRRTGWCKPKYLLVIKARGKLYAVVHMLPSTANPLNKVAKHVFRREVEACVEFFKRRGDVLMGDFNGNPHYKLLRPLNHFAHAHTARSHHLRSIDIIYTAK